MIELALAGAAYRFLFCGREELPVQEAALAPLLDREPLAVELVVMMEPTGNALHAGCLGNINATWTFTGRAGHSARPWDADNAIHTAARGVASLAEREREEHVFDGLTFYEVASVTEIRGGIAQNVIPDRVEAHVNLRYAPNHTPAEAEARLRELLGHRDVAIEIVGNAPPAPVALSNPLVTRLRDVGGLDVRPKQAWTPVAELAMFGIDAVNLGPGDPRYAHADDERVEADALVRTYDVLRRFLAGPSAT